MPNSILFKNGPLTKAEADLMKSRTTIGKQMLEDADLPHIEIAASIFDAVFESNMPIN